jgi:hypothetical protein
VAQRKQLYHLDDSLMATGPSGHLLSIGKVAVSRATARKQTWGVTPASNTIGA